MNISTFIEKYRNFVRVGIVVVLFLAMYIIAVTGGNDPIAGVYRDYTDQTANEELTELLTEYYKAYADGDIKALKKVASPISDKEKSYIKMISGYVKSYDIEEIETKPGVNRDDLLTSVKLGVHYKNLKIVAPGLDFFYIEKKNGKYHINNLYGTFNNQNGELDVDPTIITMIATFEQQEDVLELQGEVSQAFSRISLENKDFNVYFSKTLPDAVTGWAADYKKEAEKLAAKDKKKEKEEKATAKSKDDEKSGKADKSKDDKKDKTTAKGDKKSGKADKSKEDKKAKTTAKAKEDKKAGGNEAAKGHSAKKSGSTTAKVNVRSKASQSSSSLGQVGKNTKLEIYKEKNGWSKVVFNGKKGWVKSDYLKLSSEKNEKKSEAAQKEKTKASGKKSASKQTQDSKADKSKEAKQDTKADKSKEAKQDSKSDKSKSVKKDSSAKKDTVYVTEMVNIRRSADQNSDSLGKALSGTEFDRYREKGDWSEIDYKGTKAWIKTEFLTAKAPKKAKEPAEDKKSGLKAGQVIRVTSSINVRKDMDTSAGRLALLYPGDQVSVVKVYKSGWTKVTYKGKEGYIKTDVLK